MIEEKLKQYKEDYSKAVKEWERLGVVIRQLEGAIYACEDLLKLKDKDNEQG